ncbi:MAG: MotA/TolQ/ExbB proton channel family protein [Terricaulis sp.]
MSARLVWFDEALGGAVLWSRINGLIAGLAWLSSAAGLVYLADAWRRGVVADVPFIGRMLSTQDPIGLAAPIAILALFGLVLLQILSAAVHANGEQAAVGAFRSWMDNSRGQLIGRLNNPRRNRAARRANLIKNAAPGALQESVAGAAALDSSAIAAAHNWLHAFAWALPVLGFVGTATGMASSIGGFRAALIDTTRIDAVVARLSQEVIPGLSSAFETTVLALLAALVTFFCTSAVERSEEDALRRLDDMSLEILSKIGGASQAGSVQSQTALTEISRKLDRLSELATISRSLATLQEILKKMDALATTPTQLKEAVGTLKAGADALSGGAAAVDSAGKELSQASKELLASITIPYNVSIERGKRS